jgi:hypothetical protein
MFLKKEHLPMVPFWEEMHFLNFSQKTSVLKEPNIETATEVELDEA